MMYDVVAKCQLQERGHGRPLQIPVKNTFVHYDVRQCPRPRLLQRNQTDPGVDGESPPSLRQEMPDDCEDVMGCTGGTNSPKASSARNIGTDDISEDLVSDNAIQAWLAWHPQCVHLASAETDWTATRESVPDFPPAGQATMPILKLPSTSARPRHTPARGITFVQGGMGVLYHFTMRLAPGSGLGLDLQRVPGVPADRLIVKQVLPQGAIEAWNRQAVADGASSGKAVVPGDRMVRVNTSEDCEGMLVECHNATQAMEKAILLKFYFVRGIAEAAEIDDWLSQV